jgi:beta-xylosidase
MGGDANVRDWTAGDELNPALNFATASVREAWDREATLSSSKIAASTKEEAATGNPLFPGADPDIVIADKKYWIYPTADDATNDKLFVHTSPDLKHWETRGPVLNMKDISWINKDGAPYHQLWAPGILHENNKYYLYYSVGPQNPTPSRIGVAVSDSPDGEFKDIGKPLITGGNGFEAIDPMVFKDPKTGADYLYCGGSAGSKLRVFKLNSDCTSVEREVPVDTPKNFTEGAFMHYHNGVYYMSYSHGTWNKPDYSVCYSTSNSPTGPWKFKGTILKSNEEHLGPGHHAFLQNPSTGQWYIAYHRWAGAGTAGKWPDHRSVCIDNLEYDKDGNILPVVMTDTGVAPAPLK